MSDHVTVKMVQVKNAHGLLLDPADVIALCGEVEARVQAGNRHAGLVALREFRKQLDTAARLRIGGVVGEVPEAIDVHRQARILEALHKCRSAIEQMPDDRLHRTEASLQLTRVAHELGIEIAPVMPAPVAPVPPPSPDAIDAMSRIIGMKTPPIENTHGRCSECMGYDGVHLVACSRLTGSDRSRATLKKTGDPTIDRIGQAVVDELNAEHEAGRGRVVTNPETGEPRRLPRWWRLRWGGRW